MDKVSSLALDHRPNSRSTSPARVPNFLSMLPKRNDLTVPAFKAERSRSNPNSLALEDVTPTPSTTMNAGDDSPLLADETMESLNESVDDADSSLMSDKQKHAFESLQAKRNKAKAQIKELQSEKDQIVHDYLQLSGTIADRAQQTKLKQAFEKRNVKSSHAIAQLQRKVDTYNKRLDDFLTSGIPLYKPSKHALRDGIKFVSGNIREGVTAVTGLSGKPKELAHMIKSKFGSADNVSAEKSDKIENEEIQVDRGSGSITGHSVGNMPSVGGSVGKYASEEGSECSSVTSESVANQISPHHQVSMIALEAVLLELKERRFEGERLREELDSLKGNLQNESGFVSQALQEMRFRLERLEEQVNDLSDLHQSEVSSLRQGVTDMEDKVQYQSEERLRDIHEALESCQTRIAKLEHQAAYTQQYVTFDGIENGFARATLAKLITMGLTLLQVILVLVSSLAGILTPLFRTRALALSTGIAMLCLSFVISQWAELKELTSSMLRHYRETLNSSENIVIK